MVESPWPRLNFPYHLKTKTQRKKNVLLTANTRLEDLKKYMVKIKNNYISYSLVNLQNKAVKQCFLFCFL